MGKPWWRRIWPGLEPWLAQLIWLDPRVASVFWNPELVHSPQEPIRDPAPRAELLLGRVIGDIGLLGASSFLAPAGGVGGQEPTASLQDQEARMSSLVWLEPTAAALCAGVEAAERVATDRAS
jgi:hypothetical protein